MSMSGKKTCLLPEVCHICGNAAMPMQMSAHGTRLLGCACGMCIGEKCHLPTTAGSFETARCSCRSAFVWNLV